MQASDAPLRLQLAFCQDAPTLRNTIPQVQVNPGQASYQGGFPSETMQPLVAGGIPPDGKDFNGLLWATSGFGVWASAGGLFPYDSTFSGLVGGYPHGSVLQSVDLSGLWQSLADNNTISPETDTTGSWAPVKTTGYTTLSLSNANVTLTPAQGSVEVVALIGTLTANVSVTLPRWIGKRWLLRTNALNFNGFSVTARTSSGGFVLTANLNVPVYVDGAGVLQSELIQATESVPGIAAIATQALTDAGVNDAAYVTPKKARNGFAVSFSSSAGYIKLPSWLGGFMVAWGRIVTPISDGEYVLNFGVAFPNECLVVIPTIINNSHTSNYDIWPQWVQIDTTTAHCKIYAAWSGTASNQADGIAYVALGH